jgi:type IX secretion system PorP/SprF family membrane protein
MVCKIIKFSLVLFAFLLGATVNAQQDPQYTQYMYNMSVINPGYATDDVSTINAGLLYRSQWLGAVGAPTTGTLFAHGTITDRLEGGFSIVHDQIGNVVNETNTYIDLAYVIPMSKTSKLSFGIKAGATFFNTDFNGFVYSDPLPDPAFAENISRIFPNIGAGLFYFSDRYYFGVSAPNLLESKHLENDSGIVAQGSENMHLFFTGGYVFELSDSIKFKPAFMTKYIAGAPVSVDITANTLFNNKVELGAALRVNDSYSGMITFVMSPSVRIGYAYDKITSNLGQFSNASHEITLLFNINRLIKVYDKSPRFF